MAEKRKRTIKRHRDYWRHRIVGGVAVSVLLMFFVPHSEWLQTQVLKMPDDLIAQPAPQYDDRIDPAQMNIAYEKKLF